MTLFRVFLVAAFAVNAVYTVITGMNHGWNLVPVFFQDIARVDWNGQFNVDFSSFLLLTGLWVAWRHDFRPAGIGLGIFAAFGGMLFLSTYLLITSFQVGGDVKSILLGERRAHQ